MSVNKVQVQAVNLCTDCAAVIFLLDCTKDMGNMDPWVH